MTHNEALNLAQRIASRWRGTPPAAEWATALAPLPHQASLAAFAYFAKTTLDPGPTVARFVERVEMDVPPAHAAPVVRLSREQRMALLTADAPRRLVTKEGL